MSDVSYYRLFRWPNILHTQVVRTLSPHHLITVPFRPLARPLQERQMQIPIPAPLQHPLEHIISNPLEEDQKPDPEDIRVRKLVAVEPRSLLLLQQPRHLLQPGISLLPPPGIRTKRQTFLTSDVPVSLAGWVQDSILDQRTGGGVDAFEDLDHLGIDALLHVGVQMQGWGRVALFQGISDLVRIHDVGPIWEADGGNGVASILVGGNAEVGQSERRGRREMVAGSLLVLESLLYVWVFHLENKLEYSVHSHHVQSASYEFRLIVKTLIIQNEPSWWAGQYTAMHQERRPLITHFSTD